MKHRVHKLSVSEDGKAFDGYDILLSTNMRAKDVLEEAIKMADLIIVDEAHRVSPNGLVIKRSSTILKMRVNWGAVYGAYSLS